MFGLFKRDKKTAEKPQKEEASPSPTPEENIETSRTENETAPAVAETSVPAQSEHKKASEEGNGFFQRLKSRLGKTRRGFTDALSGLVRGCRKIDDELLEELEMILLSADVGIEATDRIIQALTEQVSRQTLKDPEALLQALRQQLLDILTPVARPLEIPADQRPFVILMTGVNGAGKTTTIGKLTKKLQQQDYRVMLAAGDTFRAAAVEQLQTWGERNDVPVIAQHSGADSAAVIYDALQSAKARDMDVLIADTAGRLHTQSNLMEELKKIRRVVQRLDPQAPHEVLLVVDATTGQNAIRQAQIFHEAIGLTGLVLTKLDGTAKGGIVIALAEQFGLPIRFIGVGEGVDDLQPFDAHAFVEALFD